MKYIGTQPSGVDKDINLYVFAVGKEELRCLVEAVKHIKKSTPVITETTTFRSRLNTLVKQLSGIWEKVQDTKTKNHWE